MHDFIEKVTSKALNEKRLVGVEVMVSHRGQTVFHKASGFVDRENQRRLENGTLFRLASVSKPIVTTAAMVLVQQGKLNLDTPVAHYLPTFNARLADGSTASPTLRQLMSHTSGLGYRFLEENADGPYARAGVSDGMDNSGLTLTENVRRIASVPLLFSPGSAWCYSLGIDVLGAVIEQVQGETLDKAVKTLVTGPLGMHATGFFALPDQHVAIAYVNDHPQPHPLQEGEYAAPFENTVGVHYSPARVFDPQAYPSGGAGMVGTAGDLMRLLETLRCGGGKLLTEQWVTEMGRDQITPHEIPDTPGVGFGLGFSVLRDPQLAHSPESIGTWRWGGAYGHAWFVDRARELSVVAFSNTLYEGMSGQFVNDLRDAVYLGLEGAK
jgi:CubicO group peptidase (beta-lactamase class C family)